MVDNISTLLIFKISITILLCLLGFIFQKNKFITFLLECWIIILTCFNTYSVDWGSNYGIYLNSDKYKGLLGLIMNTLKYSLNFDFTSFNGTLAFISLILMFYVIYHTVDSVNLVLSLYLIFPMIDNIVQKRFFWGFGLSLIAIYCLLKINSKLKGAILYEILIILANGFHNAYILYLALPLFLLMSRKKQLVLSFTIVFLGFFLHNKIINIMGVLLPNLQEKSQLYFGLMSETFLSIIMWTLWQVLQFWIIYQLFKNKDGKFANLIIGINIFALILIPLYSFDPVFTRCFRPILLFNYIGLVKELNINFSNGFEVINVNKNVMLCFVMYLLLVLVSALLFDIWSVTSVGFDQMVKLIYQNNSLLNYIL